MPGTTPNTPPVRGRALSGMRGFTVFWAGQFVSILGTSMTNFALTIWAWERTGAATALAPVFGWLVGAGPGAGMALVFIMAGLIGASTSLGGYLFKAVRNVESIIPDHDQATEAAVEAVPVAEEE